MGNLESRHDTSYAYTPNTATRTARFTTPPSARELEKERIQEKIRHLRHELDMLNEKYQALMFATEQEHLEEMRVDEFFSDEELLMIKAEKYEEQIELLQGGIILMGRDIRELDGEIQKKEELLEQLHQDIKQAEERRDLLIELEQDKETIRELWSQKEKLTEDLEAEEARNRPGELLQEQVHTMYQENINQLTIQMRTLTSAEQIQNVVGAIDMMDTATFHVHDEDKLKVIRHPFVSLVNPMNILHKIHDPSNTHVLVQQDIEEVTAVNTNCGRIRAAAELLSRLPRYQGWYERIKVVLRDPQVKQSHVADMMDQALAEAERRRAEEEAARTEQGEAGDEEQGAMAGQSDVDTVREQMESLFKKQISQLTTSIENLAEKNKFREAMKAVRTEGTASRPFYNEDIVKKIRTLFVSSLNPLNILHFFHKYDVDVLVQQDIDEVTSISNNRGREMGAAELLSRLPRYENWFQCTLRVLRDREVKLGHVADAMEAHVRGSGDTEDAEHQTQVKRVENDGAITSDCADGSINSVEMTEERVKQIEKAYSCQGGVYEMEFSFWNAGDLERKKAQCKKCSGHDAFIPVETFDLHHLPKNHQSVKVKTFVRTIADLCVLIAVPYTSADRPQGYPLRELAGEEYLGLYRFGNGWVTFLTDKFTDNLGQTCPCKACKSDPSKARKEWGEVRVSTTKHLVFDHHECKQTQCLCFYDTDDSLSSLPKLQGVDIVDSDLTSDRCEITCITHDIEVFQKLDRVFTHYKNLCQDVDLISRKKCSVIVSHIHGLSKMVSVGDQAQVKGTKYVYNAPTCHGSSGAPVCLLGQATKTEPYGIIPKAHMKCIRAGKTKESCGTSEKFWEDDVLENSFNEIIRIMSQHPYFILAFLIIAALVTYLKMV